MSNAKTISIDVSDLGELLVEVFQKGARQGRREADELKVEIATLVLDVDQLRACLHRLQEEATFEDGSYWHAEIGAALNATKPRVVD